MDKTKSTKLDEIKSVGGLVCAAIVVAVLIVLGQSYKDGCIRAGREYQQCWTEGLAVSGMNPGGPLSATLVIGYVIGQLNKEKEKKEMYDKGYWTPNPDLPQPTSDDPKPPQLR